MVRFLLDVLPNGVTGYGSGQLGETLSEP